MTINQAGVVLDFALVGVLAAVTAPPSWVIPVLVALIPATALITVAILNARSGRRQRAEDAKRADAATKSKSDVDALGIFAGANKTGLERIAYLETKLTEIETQRNDDRFKSGVVILDLQTKILRLEAAVFHTEAERTLIRSRLCNIRDGIQDLVIRMDNEPSAIASDLQPTVVGLRLEVNYLLDHVLVEAPRRSESA